MTAFSASPVQYAVVYCKVVSKSGLSAWNYTSDRLKLGKSTIEACPMREFNMLNTKDRA